MTFIKRTTTTPGVFTLGSAAAMLALLFVSTISGGACTAEERQFDTGGAGGTGATGGNGGEGGGGMLCTPNTEEPCYSGPLETKDVGLCKSGTHTCLSTGDGFSECGGEVVPIAENCLTPEDESCSGTEKTECPPLGDGWLKTYGSAMAIQQFNDVAVTPDGNFVGVGQFGGTIDFGNGPMASNGSLDIFMAKLDPLGNPIWTKRFGDVSTQRALTVAVDSTGAIYVGGSISGSVDFGLGTLTSAGLNDAFLAKFDGDGNAIWNKLFGDAMASQEIRQIAITAASQVIVGASFAGTISFNGTTTLTSVGGLDVAVAKFGPDGFLSTSRRFGGTSDEDLRGIALGPNTEVYVAGGYFGAFEPIPTGGTFPSKGGRDVFLLELNSSLSVLTTSTWGDVPDEDASSVAVAPNGDVFLAGTFSGGLTFFTQTLNSPDAMATAIYLVRMTGDLKNLVWAKSFGDATANVNGMQLAVDPKDQLVLAGTASGSLDFGGGLVTAVEAADPFYAKLAADGSHIASRMIPNVAGGNDNGNMNITVALLPGGDVIAGGVHRAPFLFGGQAIGSPDFKDGDAFLARLLH